MRELDVLLNRFIDTRYRDLSATERDTFDALIGESDVDLYSWLMGRSRPDNPKLAQLATQIRNCGS